MVCGISDRELDLFLERALLEDAPYGDKTTEALSIEKEYKSTLIAKEDLVVCGLPAAIRVFELAGRGCKFRILLEDGATASPGDTIAEITGPLNVLLLAERTALNLLQRLSGIASMARRSVTEIEGTSTKIFDTRKTTPGMRVLEKYAVRTGGALNHRMGLSDAILIKDNHIAATGSVEETVSKVKANTGSAWRIEVEVRSLEQIPGAVNAGADIILLDNMTPEQLREAVRSRPEGILFEASGGITPDNLRTFAETGVDFISMGALTHSARAVDISMDIDIQ